MESTTAIILGYLGVALMVGLSGVASCIGTSIAGMASVGAMKKNGGAFGSYMILSAIPGSQGLYGFVGYFIIKGFLTDSMTLLQGAAIFGAGLLTGLPRFVVLPVEGLRQRYRRYRQRPRRDG